MKTYTTTIAAGAEVQINQPGSTVYLKTSAVDLIVSDNVNGFDVPLSQGDEYNAIKPFTAVALKNNSGGSVAVVVAVGNGSVRKAPPSTLTLAAQSTAIDSVADVSIGAGATSQIAAVDATRREILIANLSTNTAILRIGDSGAAAANGLPLVPGASITLTTTAAVHGYNPGAGAQSVAVLSVLS